MKKFSLKKVLSFLIISCSLFFFSACGYKPSSYYAKQELKGSIFVNLDVSLEDAKNSVIIKDTLDELLVGKLDANLVYDVSLADTIIDLKIKSIDINELQYDKSGYVKLYDAVTTIEVKYKNSKYSRIITLSGSHNFSVDDGKEITEAKRFEAIKSSASKALEEFVSKIAVENFRK